MKKAGSLIKSEEMFPVGIFVSAILARLPLLTFNYDNGTLWEIFPRYWHFVRSIRRPSILHKKPVMGSLKFSSLATWVTVEKQTQSCWLLFWETMTLIWHKCSLTIVLWARNFDLYIHNTIFFYGLSSTANQHAFALAVGNKCSTYPILSIWWLFCDAMVGGPVTSQTTDLINWPTYPSDSIEICVYIGALEIESMAPNVEDLYNCVWCTVGCRYNAIKYKNILCRALWWQRHSMNRSL